MAKTSLHTYTAVARLPGVFLVITIFSAYFSDAYQYVNLYS